MDKDIQDILDGIQPEKKQQDCKVIFNMLSEVTKTEPRVWGKQMIGFGTYTYKRSDGKEGEWFMTGFAPRSQNISVYLLAGFEHDLKPYLDSLGPHRLGKGCLYIKNLDDIDVDVLKTMMEKSYEVLSNRYKI